MNQSEDQAGFESLVSRHLNAMLRVAAALVGVAEMVAGQSSDGTPLVYLDLGDAFNGFSPSAETVQVYGTSERALLPAPTQGFPARQNPGRQWACLVMARYSLPPLGASTPGRPVMFPGRCERPKLTAP
jgi:hypothetical protein